MYLDEDVLTHLYKDQGDCVSAQVVMFSFALCSSLIV